jgi:CheY-like chemotaxis protein
MIFDVMLPGFSGRELTERLAAQGVATPILMLTALDATEDKVEGLRGGRGRLPDQALRFRRTPGPHRSAHPAGSRLQ